jgi:predicted DNA-binding WGR domain protein
MSTIIKEIKLINISSDVNMNRWWTGRLYDNDDVETLWGRVGYDGDSKMFSGAGQCFLEKKEREKAKKGYTELKVVGGTNGNAAAPTSVKNTDLNVIAKSQILKVSNPTLSRLIDRLVQANVHKITANTQITYNSTTGLFATPLGIVSIDGLIEARDLLAKIAPFVRNAKWGSEVDSLLNLYLRLIPQNLGMKRFSTDTLIPDDNALQKQNDLIDSLESSYQALQTAPPPKAADGKKVEQVFKVDMDVLADARERSRLEAWFERSKKSMHHYDHVRVREIYSLSIQTMNDKFMVNDPRIVEVFHGSSMANVLSILKCGLKISPPSTAAIAGSLFGRGLYGAINSTKSLGYSLNRWGQGGVGDAAFLFVCSFVMGKIYETRAYGCSKPSGYDSVWAKASSGGLHNDELIVYTEARAKINYLLECK